MLNTPEEIFTAFESVKSSYGARLDDLIEYERFFVGDHWNEAPQAEDSTSYQLTYNYCKAIVLKYAALLSKAPRIRINIVSNELTLKQKAQKRERFLQGIWPSLMTAWRDVEFNASKKTFGVIEVVWDPGPGQPETIEVGVGKDVTKTLRYTDIPIKFKSIEPEKFFPVYRTFDKPDDFLYVMVEDPGRLVEDIKETYKVNLQSTDVQEGTDGTCDLLQYWDSTNYKLLAKTTYYREVRMGKDTKRIPRSTFTVLQDFKHEYERIPFFVVQNLRNPGKDPCYDGSIGDIDSVAHLNKHYNVIMSEAAEEIALHIHNPVAYKSDDPKQDVNNIDFKPGALIPIGKDEDLSPIMWPGLAGAVEEHLNRTQAAIEDLTFVGEAGFGRYPSGASGIGLRLVLSSLEQIMGLKIPLRQNALADICKHLFKIIELKTGNKEAENYAPLQLWLKDHLGRYGQVQITKEDINRDYFVDIDYGNLLPRNETEHQQNEVYKYKTGAQSLWETLDNIGVDNPDEAISRIKQEQEDVVLNPEKAMAIAQAKLSIAQALMQLKQLNEPPPQPQPGSLPGQPSSPVPGAAGNMAPPTNSAPLDMMNAGQMDPNAQPGNLAPFLARGGQQSVNQGQLQGGGGAPRPNQMQNTGQRPGI